MSDAPLTDQQLLMLEEAVINLEKIDLPKPEEKSMSEASDQQPCNNPQTLTPPPLLHEDYGFLVQWMLENMHRLLDLQQDATYRKVGMELINMASVNVTKTIGLLLTLPWGIFVLDVNKLLECMVPYHPEHRFLGSSFRLDSVCKNAAAIFYNNVQSMLACNSAPPSPQGQKPHDLLLPIETTHTATTRISAPPAKKRKPSTPKNPKPKNTKPRKNAKKPKNLEDLTAMLQGDVQQS